MIEIIEQIFFKIRNVIDIEQKFSILKLEDFVSTKEDYIKLNSAVNKLTRGELEEVEITTSRSKKVTVTKLNYE